MTTTISASDQDAQDAAALASLGYRQQLTRALGLSGNFAIGFTYLSPLVGVYSLFTYGLGLAGGAVFWSIPIVMAGQLLVMLTFAEVASQYPIAGGIYQWSKNLVGPRYAWLSGWVYTWALLVTVASVAYPISTYAGPLFGYTVTHTTTVVTAIVVILLAALVNLAGIRRLSFVAYVGVAVEVVGTLGIGLYLMFFHNHNGFGAIFKHYGAGAGGYVGAFLAAALFSVWIFYGFEACGDIAEEVKDPSRKIPKAMGWTLGVGGLATIVLTLGLTMAVPSIPDVVSGKDTDAVGTTLADALGSGGMKFALALIVLGFASCTLAIQAAATRLVYSFGRDGMVIGSRRLAAVHPRFHMPPVATAVTAIIPALLTLLPSATVARIITFAVVGIYTGFQFVVLAAIIARARGWVPAGRFTLGRWGWYVNVLGLVYGVSAIVILSIKTPPNGPGFFDRWLVPISVGIVALAGLMPILFRPVVNINDDARPEAEAVVEMEAVA
ncbi:MAG TPA: amino acid permease [Micromonosporaceae bacterium]|jgi:amino acid transporter